MVKLRPSVLPSTPLKMNQNGFHQLVQHNAITSYPHESFEYDDGTQMPARPQSAYSSPPMYHDSDHRYGSLPPSGLGITYDRGYSPDAHHYGQGRYVTPGTASPLSPSTTPGSTEPIRTRSGLNINRPIQPHKTLPQDKPRTYKSPKTKKLKKDKTKTENTVAKLEKPLSELTKDWTHVPVVDIEAYVNRSAEERRKEVAEGKQPGKVKRPMNSFMLYRKAYQNRTKNWCLQNNHQVVSQVCGDSWPLEPESVRQQFNEWAKLERINHQNAHPGYKFSPSKAGAAPVKPPPKRKISVSEEPESEASELDDFDWERGTSRRPKKHVKQEHRATPNPFYLNSPYNYSRDVSEEPSYQSYSKQRSTYQASNPGRQPPPQYSQSNLHNGQYYAQSVRPTFNILGAEDVIMRRAPTPGMTYQQPLGIPTGHDYASMSSYHDDMTADQRIDPSLVAHDNGMFNDDLTAMYNIGDISQSDPKWHGSVLSSLPGQDDPLGMNESTYDNLQIHDQHLQMLKGNQDSWQVESLDNGQEFDKWMAEP